MLYVRGAAHNAGDCYPEVVGLFTLTTPEIGVTIPLIVFAIGVVGPIGIA